MAIEPSLVADRDDRVPRNPPIGVRATPTMQTSIEIKHKRSNNENTSNLSEFRDMKFNALIFIYFFFMIVPDGSNEQFYRENFTR